MSNAAMEGLVVAPIRFMAFDIESTSLDASYGRLLCACGKFGDEKRTRTTVAPKLKDELSSLREIKDWFKRADVIYTWYGKRFDVPFVNSRLLHYEEEPLPLHIHKDLWSESRSKLKFRGNRLDGVSKDLRAQAKKHDLTAATWVEATDGDSKALAQIVKHCEFDVYLTEEMLHRMKSLIWNFTR